MNDESTALDRIKRYIEDIHEMSDSDDSAHDHAQDISQSAVAAHTLLAKFTDPNDKLERIRKLVNDHATKEQHPSGTINGIRDVLNRD